MSDEVRVIDLESPENIASLIFDCSQKQFQSMNKEEFENWIAEQKNSQKITTDAVKMTMPEEEKQEVLEHIMLLYNKDQSIS